MANLNTMFTRQLLSMAVAELKLKHPAIKSRKDAWVWHAGRDCWEFHGPALRQNAHPKEEFYWHGRAHDAYEARYKGWMAWMEKQDEKIAAHVQRLVGEMHR